MIVKKMYSYLNVPRNEFLKLGCKKKIVLDKITLRILP